MGFDTLEVILFVFLIALTVTVIFRQLKLSVILGYLLVGALVGPHALAIVPNSDAIKQVAEFGIVFLMFTVGLEFSLPTLISLKKPVFVIGGIQVTLTLVLTTLAAVAFGLPVLSALVIASITAMSSTAIVVKQLNDQLELHTQHGLNAVGILLFQDLAVVPLIILIAGLARPTQNGLGLLLIWALVKGIFAFLLIFTIGRWLLRPIFHLISKTRAIELFTLTVLLVTLTAAWLTNALGLSFALGAFLAGIMLAETEFRHQIEVEIRPFRDILLGLFFVTIGMLTDASTWSHTWFPIALLFSGIVFGKILLITLISRLSGNSLSTSMRTGLVLAQGGEFGFALLTLAVTENILPPHYSQIVLAALLLSIAISPIIIRYNQKIVELLLPQTAIAKDLTASKQEISMAAQSLKHHIIICGYGRVGQHIARLLGEVDFPYIGLDLNSQLVKQASLAGEKVMYGDPTHPSILVAAGLDSAQVLVISFNDLKATTEILSMVRRSHPKLPILVRCRDETELKQLRRFGATQIIAELFEQSITMSHHLLNLIDIPVKRIHELMQELRSEDYNLLLKVYAAEDQQASAHDHLYPIIIPPNAYAINHTLSDLKLNQFNTEVVAIRRDNSKQLQPHGNTKILANDIIIVYGANANLELAEKKLLNGSD